MSEAETQAPVDFSQWTKVQKLAGLILMLNAENATCILKGLEENLLEAVTSEMAKFATISQEVQVQILQEFSSVAVEAGVSVPCGIDRVQGMLEKSVGMLRSA